MKHQLYRTGDADAPESILDQNGEVALDLCRICNKAEAELKEACLSTREQALRWWRKLSFNHKNGLHDKYLGPRRQDPLDGNQIEEIWRKENFYEENVSITDDIGDRILKPNQKQFKEFNSELFKAYIDEFDPFYYSECIGIIADKLTLAQLDAIQEALNLVYQHKIRNI